MSVTLTSFVYMHSGTSRWVRKKRVANQSDLEIPVDQPKVLATM
jgi:hypothetical protein